MANSIMTNASAMTALKTLNMTNKSLEKTQSTISTGYRVAEAADNAAYWSIATTMRSDNKALSTVNDALGLGKATVDVAYTALNSSKTVLDEIKTKLVAAKQPGVDKAKVQSEIGQLQKQLQGIASASSFSGNNWLSVNSGDGSYNAVQKVVSSFSRGSDGALSVGAVDIDISKIALFDAGADSLVGGKVKGMGLLEKGIGNTDAGSLAATGVGATAVSGQNVAATSGGFTTSGFNLTGLSATNKIVFDATINGTTTTGVEVTLGADIDAFIANFNANPALAGVKASKVSGEVKFESQLTGSSSNFTLANVAYKTAANGSVTGSPDAKVAGTGTAGNNATSTGGTHGKASMDVNFGSAVKLDADDTISFDIALDGGNTKTLTINKSVIDSELGVSNGTISNATDMAKVLANVFNAASVAATADGSTGKLVITSSATGASSSVALTNVKASNGGNSFGVMDIDITSASSAKLDEYIAGIDKMAQNVTTAAADLGAVKSRIGMQTDFVKNLMDAIDRGVGTLVDADMNEESTKLQALQVQQQLGIQALSMANGSSQSILSLFRS